MNLSTGVLAKETTVVFAGITIANVDPIDTFSVSVFVIDWSSGSPSLPIPTSIPNPIILPPNTFQQVTANLGSASFYEIRIVCPYDNDLIINCYGLLTSSPFAIVQGNTVLHHELIEVEVM